MPVDITGPSGRRRGPALRPPGGHRRRYPRHRLPPLRPARRLGRAQIVRALYWHSLRSAFGIGRGAKAKIFPVITFVLICLPAVVNAVAVAQGTAASSHTTPTTTASASLSMIIFVAAQAPSWSPATCAATCCRCTSPGRCAAWTTRWPSSPRSYRLPDHDRDPGASAVRGHDRPGAQRQRDLAPDQAAGPRAGVALMWAVLLAAIGLALASLSGRRAYATGAIAIFFFLTWILANILISVNTRNVVHVLAPQGGGPPPGGPGNIGPPVSITHVTNTAAHLSGLVSPFTILDGVRQWLGGTSVGPVPGVAGYGAIYGVLFLVCWPPPRWPGGRYRKAASLDHARAADRTDRAEQCLPLVRQRGGRQRHHDDDRARSHRPAGPERRWQVDGAAPDRRLPARPRAATLDRRRQTSWRNPDIYRPWPWCQNATRSTRS